MGETGYDIFFPEHTVPLHAMLVNAGHGTITSHSYYWDGLKRGNRELYVWQYTLGGRGELRLDGKSYRLTRGDALFVRIPEAHVYCLPPDSAEWQIQYLSFYGKEAGRLGQEIRDHYGSVLRLDPGARSVRTALDILRQAARGSITGKYQSSRLAYDFITCLLEDLEHGDEANSSRSELFNRVYAYASRHLAEAIGVEELAKQCGYSRSHFSRLFHELQGMTPGEFLNDLRLTLALRLLQTERLSVKEIAQRCGFTDASYFCRVFRKRYGITPERFRIGK